MTKHDLTKAIAAKAGLALPAAEAAYDTLLASIAACVAKDGECSVPGLGRFHVHATAARKGRNPRTQEIIDIPAGKRVAFTASKALKYAVTKG